MLPVIEIMMPAQQPTGNVPAFLAKLWKMVDNPETDLLISWSDDGSTFVIRDQSEFARQLLPYYYKHSNMASFVRQLNMYGFHKVMSVDSGGLKGEKDENEFAHPFFMRGQEHLLDQIKRKVSAAGARQGSASLSGQFVPSIKSDKVNEVLTEVGQLKERQEDLDGKLDLMKDENEALWTEVLSLRQKHTQQQKIVNKLINFLVALVQPRMGGLKRRYPGVPVNHLAIEEGSCSMGPTAAKGPKLDIDEQNSGGPVIFEIDPSDTEMTGYNLNQLLSDVPPGTVQEISVPTAQSTDQSAGHNSPLFSHYSQKIENQGDILSVSGNTVNSKYRLVDPSSVNPSPNQVVKKEGGPNQLISSKRPILHREISKEDFDIDINSMQSELDNLKELLSGQITLDSSLVSSLFSSEDNLSGLLSDTLANTNDEISVNDQQDNIDNSGIKLVTYNPSMFELTEEDNSGDIGDKSLENTTFEMDLNTPLIQEDNTNPMKFFYKK